ncbi:MAG: bifunctional DNA-formamidopyrimidine glycosylase/DNA-(apurinic or apyrimidinic site) lyase [Candidatus Edwardsbacteria bacterium]|nr:bifunctional DNA-formamidopyrimidine glycosylase/DNA-(apurinic or apyrimidinic site) lyase [Candidatus Edwardsbacteria bacterium]
MPELPEVETVRRDLTRSLAGKRIERVDILNASSLKGATPKGFLGGISGRSFIRFDRRGKYLILHLDTGKVLVVHLKMTGVLQYQQKGDSLPRAARIIFYFSGGRRLVFSDQRKFGSIELARDAGSIPSLQKMGPEPLEKDFTPEALKERLGGRRGPIKPLLLDQAIIAGLGNIYAAEALHRAGIAPQRPANQLSGPEIKKLHHAIFQVLGEAIAARGSSVDTYRDGQGKKGWFQVKHRVYGKQGTKCRRCGGTIVKEIFRGRGTYWCPKCQR